MKIDGIWPKVWKFQGGWLKVTGGTEMLEGN